MNEKMEEKANGPGAINYLVSSNPISWWWSPRDIIEATKAAFNNKELPMRSLPEGDPMPNALRINPTVEHELETVRRAVFIEREACARLVESSFKRGGWVERHVLELASRMIRARK